MVTMSSAFCIPHLTKSTQKGKAKEARASIREKVKVFLYLQYHTSENLQFSSQYKLDPTPEPSDEDIESSDDEEDGFGNKKKEEEEEDPAASKSCHDDDIDEIKSKLDVPGNM